MNVKHEYVIFLPLAPGVGHYLGPDGGSTRSLEEARPFPTISEADHARSRLNNKWRAGAVIRMRIMTSVPQYRSEEV